MVIKTDYEFNEQEISYEVLENGYTIYLGGKPWISQQEPYIPYPELGYEKSCLRQIDDIVKSSEEQKSLVERLALVESSQSVQDGAIVDLATMIGGE